MKIAKFCERLKEALNVRGWSQADLVRATGYGKSKVSQWISGRNDPNGSALATLASVLDVDEGWLMGYDWCRMSRQPQVELEQDTTIYTDGWFFNAVRTGSGLKDHKFAELINIPINRVKDIENGDDATIDELKKLLNLVYMCYIGEITSPKFVIGLFKLVIDRMDDELDGGTNVRDPSELTLISAYRNLSDRDKRRAIEQVCELAELARYRDAATSSGLDGTAVAQSLVG